MSRLTWKSIAVLGGVGLHFSCSVYGVDLLGTPSGSAASGMGGDVGQEPQNPPSTCVDGEPNAAETDIDCGGNVCEKCSLGRKCLADSDCAMGECTEGICRASSCIDGYENGNETDIDCGGDSCGPCTTDKKCAAASDCQSSVCAASRCQAPSCSDEVKNGVETDTDCGGTCEGCGYQKVCKKGPDCASGEGELALVCDDGTCALACPGNTADCNSSLPDQCEVTLDTDPAHCGACGDACDLPNASSTCAAFSCEIAKCSPGFDNCNGEPDDGCEQDTLSSIAHCGACELACSASGANVAQVNCEAGACRVSCTPGFCRASEDAQDCTLSLGTTQNCSSCGDVCSGERPYCLNGACSEVNGTPCASFPVPAKNTWSISAYRTSQYTTDPPSYAIDGNTNTRYANGGDMNSNDWIQIDFGKKVAITQVQLVHDGTDYARGYAMLMTDSPPNQNTAAEVSGSNSSTTMTVNQLLAGRYLRIRQTGSAAQWWSVKEVNVSCTGP